jgi:hypothetical protein
MNDIPGYQITAALGEVFGLTGTAVVIRQLAAGEPPPQ